jgi:hypothetical protein
MILSAGRARHLLNIPAQRLGLLNPREIGLWIPRFGIAWVCDF